MTLYFVLLFVAIILFLLESFRVKAPISLGWLGMAFLVLALLI